MIYTIYYCVGYMLVWLCNLLIKPAWLCGAHNLAFCNPLCINECEHFLYGQLACLAKLFNVAEITDFTSLHVNASIEWLHFVCITYEGVPKRGMHNLWGRSEAWYA